MQLRRCIVTSKYWANLKHILLEDIRYSIVYVASCSKHGMHGTAVKSSLLDWEAFFQKTSIQNCATHTLLWARDPHKERCIHYVILYLKAYVFVH